MTITRQTRTWTQRSSAYWNSDDLHVLLDGKSYVAYLTTEDGLEYVMNGNRPKRFRTWNAAQIAADRAFA